MSIMADGDHAAHALLFHRHAVERVATLHGALAVRYDDELRALRVLGEIIGKIADVRIVQRGLDFVQNAEGRGLEFEHGEENGDGRQRALAARQEREHLQLLSRRLRDDFDAACERFLRVFKPQLCASAAEKFRKCLTEVDVQLLKLRFELFFHLAGELADDAEQIALRL